MKRHPSLQALSQDHNVGLVMARRLQQGAVGSVEAFLQAWQEEMTDHFDDQERLLVRLCSAGHAAMLRNEHRVIRTLVTGLQDGDPSASAEVGTMLHDHIRWEERTLFPAIEASATDADLDFLAKESGKLEARRSTSQASQLRGELNGQSS